MSATPSYLASLVGSNVTIPAYSTNLVAIPARTWKIISKVDQDVVMRDHNDIADGLSAAHVAVKFRCVSVGSREPPQQALMRIYKQLPIAGTELDDLETRSTQAAKTFDCPEAQALYNMKRQNCKVVPELLGLQVTRQPEHDWVPGGILIYVVWEHVAGDSLDFDEFWRLPFVKRQAIRAKFAETFSKFIQYGWNPLMNLPSKIIYDKASGDMKISGFKWAMRFDRPRKWKETDFCMFGLVLRPDELDDFKPPQPDRRDWTKDEQGCWW